VYLTGLTGVPRRLQDAPSPRKNQGRVLKSSWTSIKGRQMLGIEEICQIVQRV
jgi:hypothetical protein